MTHGLDGVVTCTQHRGSESSAEADAGLGCQPTRIRDRSISTPGNAATGVTPGSFVTA